MVLFQLIPGLTIGVQYTQVKTAIIKTLVSLKQEHKSLNVIHHQEKLRIYDPHVVYFFAQNTNSEPELAVLLDTAQKIEIVTVRAGQG